MHPTPKNAAVREEYFAAVLDVKCFYKDDKMYYFVGTATNKLQTSLHNACLLREIIATGGELFFERLMNMLTVEFVRNGQYTVVPFSIKYLNEVAVELCRW